MVTPEAATAGGSGAPGESCPVPGAERPLLPLEYRYILRSLHPPSGEFGCAEPPFSPGAAGPGTAESNQRMSCPLSPGECRTPAGSLPAPWMGWLFHPVFINDFINSSCEELFLYKLCAAVYPLRGDGP